MNRAFLLGLLGALAWVEACQPLDTSVTTENSLTAPGLDDAGLPWVFADADLSQQCAPNSALCYELCGSPSCALLSNDIPGELRTPPIQLQDGATQDPCVQIEAESLAIRQRSCGQCHATAPGQAGFSVILDDNALLSTVSAGTMPLHMLVPGDPASSYIYQRLVNSISSPQSGMPPISNPGIPDTVFNTVVRPTSADISVMYWWILACAPGANSSALSSSFYGGNYAPSPDGSTAVIAPVDAGAPKETGTTTPVVDASVPVDSGRTTVVDAGTTTVVDTGTVTVVDSGGGGHPNLLTNGNLRVVSGTGTLTVMGNGEMCVAVPANEATIVGWPAPAGTAGITLEATDSYTFSYTALTTRAAVVLDTVVGDTLPPYTPVDFESKSDPISMTAMAFSHPFTPASGADTSAGISFSFTSTVAQSVCFENLSLVTN